MKLPGFTAEQSLRQVISHGLSKNLFSPKSKEEVVPQGYMTYCPVYSQRWGVDLLSDNLGPLYCIIEGDFNSPYIVADPLLEYLP
jgi:hypothetical protein